MPAGKGAMAAIMGLSPAVVCRCLQTRRRMAKFALRPILNSPDQTVISGDADADKTRRGTGLAGGAKRAMILAVSAPFHSALMMPAQEKLEGSAKDEFHRSHFRWSPTWMPTRSKPASKRVKP